MGVIGLKRSHTAAARMYNVFPNDEDEANLMYLQSAAIVQAFSQKKTRTESLLKKCGAKPSNANCCCKPPNITSSGDPWSLRLMKHVVKLILSCPSCQPPAFMAVLT